MSEIESHITLVNEKLQQLLKKYAALKKENESLSVQLGKLKNKEEEFANTTSLLNEKINILQVASGSISGSEQKDFEKRINQYIKEIDKCIALLSD